MINNVVLVGRLTKDPELRQTQSGVAVARFTLAVNRPFSNQNGEKQADFISIVVWRKQAENCAQFLHKGSLAGVQGRIQTGSYEGQDGKRVYTTEVIADNVQFLEPKNANSNYQQGQGGFQQQGGYQQQPYNGGNQNQFGGNQFGNSQQGGYQQPSYQQNQPTNQNYTNMNEDPFATPTDNKKVDVSEDDLPF